MPDVSAENRRIVESRADFRCEYCGIAEDDSFNSPERIILIRQGRYPV